MEELPDPAKKSLWINLPDNMQIQTGHIEWSMQPAAYRQIVEDLANRCIERYLIRVNGHTDVVFTADGNQVGAQFIEAPDVSAAAPLPSDPDYGYLYTDAMLNILKRYENAPAQLPDGGDLCRFFKEYCIHYAGLQRWYPDGNRSLETADTFIARSLQSIEQLLGGANALEAVYAHFLGEYQKKVDEKTAFTDRQNAITAAAQREAQAAEQKKSAEIDALVSEFEPVSVKSADKVNGKPRGYGKLYPASVWDKAMHNLSPQGADTLIAALRSATTYTACEEILRKRLERRFNNHESDYTQDSAGRILDKVIKVRPKYLPTLIEIFSDMWTVSVITEMVRIKLDPDQRREFYKALKSHLRS